MTLSSPEYPRGHGLIERHVQTVKKCMRKCKRGGGDFDLALLSLRATPLDCHLDSPAEILNGRKYRSTVPSIQVLKPEVDRTRERLEERQQSAKKYYDRTVRPTVPLTVDQNVRVFDKRSRTWAPGSVVGFAETPRSYHVKKEGDGRVIRRNLQHIKPTRERRFEVETYNDPMDDFVVDTPADPQSTNTDDSESDGPAVVPPSASLRDGGLECASQRGHVSRYGRTRKQTNFYQAS